MAKGSGCCSALAHRSVSVKGERCARNAVRDPWKRAGWASKASARHRESVCRTDKQKLLAATVNIRISEPESNWGTTPTGGDGTLRKEATRRALEWNDALRSRAARHAHAARAPSIATQGRDDARGAGRPRPAMRTSRSTSVRDEVPLAIKVRPTTLILVAVILVSSSTSAHAATFRVDTMDAWT
jgi:hypothetical protein